jgi:D-glycero-alpha-D-manno-heptose-7-phosphate kinase
MVIASTAPCRISLFGGGTDVDPFVSDYGSVIISFAVNIHQTVLLYPHSDLLSSFPEGADTKYVFQVLKNEGMDVQATRINSYSEAKLKSGLGASAAFTVALLAAIGKYKNKTFSRFLLSEEAYDAEIEMGWYGGRQDQIASAFGGFNRIEITARGVEIIPFKREIVEPLLQSMALFHIGKRTVNKIQDGFRELDPKRREYLKNIKSLAIDAIPLIEAQDYAGLGEMLNFSWEFKKKSNPLVSNPKVDEIYSRVINAGALGGKLCGAGDGGYMFFIIPPNKRGKVLNRIFESIGPKEIDFGYDWTGVDVKKL